MEIEWKTSDGKSIYYTGNGEFTLPDGSTHTIEFLTHRAFMTLLVVVEALSLEVDKGGKIGPVLHARMGHALMQATENVEHLEAIISLLTEAPMMTHAMTCDCRVCAEQREALGYPRLQFLDREIDR